MQKIPINEEPLDYLELADPEMSKSLRSIIGDHHNAIDLDNRQIIVETILWAMSIEIELGYTVFRGFEQLLPCLHIDLIDQYNQKIRYYAQCGASLGLLVAEILPIVLLTKQTVLIHQFYQTIQKLNDIGVYILHRPIQSFGRMVLSGDMDSALQMLRLFDASFSYHLDFHQSKKLTQFLPQLCESIPQKNRAFQIKKLISVAKIDIEWLYACEIGFKKGLYVLNSTAFSTFIEFGIQKYQYHTQKGRSYFSIESEISKHKYENLQTGIFLNAIISKLTQYLHARIGCYVKIHPLSQLKDIHLESRECVLSNSQCIYLPDEISIYSHKTANYSLFKHLLRWEASHLEWETYDFDLEKWCDLYPDIDIRMFTTKGSDLNRFLFYFSNPSLATDLFNIFEHTRIRLCLTRCYPGILKKTLPIFQQWIVDKGVHKCSSPLQQLYNSLALDMISSDPIHNEIQIIMHQSLNRLEDMNAGVETSASLVFLYFSDILDIIQKDQSCQTIQIPFYRRIDINSTNEIIPKWQDAAKHIYQALKQDNIKVYLSDIKKKLRHQQGQLNVSDIQKICVSKDMTKTIDQKYLCRLLSGRKDIEIISDINEPETVYRYHEWDAELDSYRLNHTRLIQQKVSQDQNEIYDRALMFHSGLLRQIKRRFEMLRPEGLKILRRWSEGDDFDYRQLLEYGINRKIHQTSSDRLYTKRVKEYRDVAVFLLIDLSRSTANIISHSDKPVIEIEQEAMILFCEALKQCGDPFAIAGFSGTGRHSVHFYLIKQMDEMMSHAVKYKIGNICPYRNTRVGAAIRHATFLFEKVAAKIRLLIVLSDGFPNDIGYKNDYAIKDSRKSITEAKSKGVYVHGITINNSSSARLDKLFGKGNHHVISDVTELPDRLPLIYHYLTKP